MALTLGVTLVTTASVAWAQNGKLPVSQSSAGPPTAQDNCNGNLWQGSGNPNSTFQRKRNLDGGVELGIKAIMRMGPDIRSTYVDGEGLVHIEVPTGAQVGNPNRAAWNFTYSVQRGTRSRQRHTRRV